MTRDEAGAGAVAVAGASAGTAARSRWKWWYMLAAISIFAMLLGCWSIQLVLHHMQAKEQARAELYWNGYVQLYDEWHDGWDGLQERLERVGYLYAGEASFSIRVYDKEDANSAIAAVSRGRADEGRLLPVIRQGEIAGYTRASLTAYEVPSWLQAGVPILFGLFVFSMGLWMRRKLHKAGVRAEDRLAAELAAFMKRARDGIPEEEEWAATMAGGQRMRIRERVQTLEERAGNLAGTQSTAAPEDEPKEAKRFAWPVLLREIGGVMQRNRRLETVRTTMVADIAHELRTPIAIMRAALDHALQAGVPLAVDRLAGLHDESLRLSRLVRDLQELALAESGHLPLHKSWFSLTELAQGVLEALSADGYERGVQYELSGLGQTMVYGDRGRIKQLLINLVGNAFRHAEMRVTVDLALTGSSVTLKVGDDGPGIEEEELDRVFDRFYRGAETRIGARERGAGLGLGLAIVREFARAHGGEASVRSRYGQGATFVVTLPVINE